MQCLDTLAPVACLLHSKPDITIFTYGCTFNVFHVVNVKAPNPLALAMGHSLIRTLMVLHGSKLPLILLAHSLHQTQMVMWNSLPLYALTPQLILLRLQESLRNLANTLLHDLSISSSLSITLDQCNSFMIMGKNLLGLPFNSFYSC